MRFRQPVWQLRRDCPVCGQGSSLALIACPSCSHVAVICDEERSAFGTPATISADQAVSPEETPCPGCGTGTLAIFDVATADDLVRSGLTPADYT